MKKLSILVLTLVLALTLTGCGNKVESSTCSMGEKDGIDQTFKFSATNGKVDKVELNMVFNNSLFGVETLETLDDAQKEQIKTTMLKNLGLTSDTYEGLEIIVDIQDKMSVTVKADIEKADPEILKKIGMDLEGVDMGYKRAISDMEKAGATCK